jgi:hypothetical protein
MALVHETPNSPDPRGAVSEDHEEPFHLAMKALDVPKFELWPTASHTVAEKHEIDASLPDSPEGNGGAGRFVQELPSHSSMSGELAPAISPTAMQS